MSFGLPIAKVYTSYYYNEEFEIYCDVKAIARNCNSFLEYLDLLNIEYMSRTGKFTFTQK